MIREDGKTIIATTEKASKKMMEKLKKKGAAILVCGKWKVDLRKLVFGLNAMGIRRIMIEGGSEINASALEAGVVDKLFLFMAPIIIGGKGAKGIIGGEGIGHIKDALKLKKLKATSIGREVLLECDL